mmetsp:Transcript_5664/g.14030  ORF Transcript_5664/g.14030 Transcript_5664/m.14030 type:complete len:206 (+) Transcript_5664:2935-3552(+)
MGGNLYNLEDGAQCRRLCIRERNLAVARFTAAVKICHDRGKGIRGDGTPESSILAQRFQRIDAFRLESFLGFDLLHTRIGVDGKGQDIGGDLDRVTDRLYTTARSCCYVGTAESNQGESSRKFVEVSPCQRSPEQITDRNKKSAQCQFRVLFLASVLSNGERQPERSSNGTFPKSTDQNGGQQCGSTPSASNDNVASNLANFLSS